MPSSRSASWWYETKFKQGWIGGYTGVIILPTQTMHYYKGNSSKLPYICIVWFPPNGQFNDACYTTPLWKVSSDPYWPQWDGTRVFRRLLTLSPHFSLKFIWHHSVLPQKDAAMMKHWRYIHFNKHGKNHSFLSRNYLKWSIFLTDMWSLRSPILCFLGKGRVGNFLPSKRIFLEQSWRTNSSIFQDLHDLEVVEQKRQPSPNIVQIHIYQTSLLPFLVKKHQKKHTREPQENSGWFHSQ